MLASSFKLLLSVNTTRKVKLEHERDPKLVTDSKKLNGSQCSLHVMPSGNGDLCAVVENASSEIGLS